MKSARAALLIVFNLIFALHVCAAPGESAVARGRKVYQNWCYPCHGRGVGKPGTDALAAHYKGKKPAVLVERTDLTPEMIRYFVRHRVLFMPSLRKTEISDADLNAIAAHLMQFRKK